MKHLIDILKEEYATPACTTGMGNPMPPTETHPGSEPLVISKKKKKQKTDPSK